MPESMTLQKAAVCGLWCGACSLHLATLEGGDRLKSLAKRLELSIEDARCQGCRSDTLFQHCRACSFRDCAAERKLQFCAECVDFPCEKLQAFQAEKPHRADLWRDAQRLRDVGGEAWLAEIPARYACPACTATNSAYDLTCRACGHAPASPFVLEHGEAVKTALRPRAKEASRHE